MQGHVSPRTLVQSGYEPYVGMHNLLLHPSVTEVVVNQSCKFTRSNDAHISKTGREKWEKKTIQRALTIQEWKLLYQSTLLFGSCVDI